MSPPTMQAAVATESRSLALVERSRPEPGAGEVRIRVDACGICGSDLHLLRAGLMPAGLTPGHEVAGRVDAAGAGVTGLRAGTPVAVEPFLTCGHCAACRSGRDPLCSEARLLGVHTHGGLAEYLVAPAERLFPAPAALPPDTLSLAEPLAVCLHGLRRGGLATNPAGKRVLVLGAGAIGLLTLLAARSLGATSLWITARHPHQAEAARRLGAERVLTEHEANAEALAHMGRSDAVDLVVESVGGNAGTLGDAVAAARPGGTVVVLGMFMEPITLHPMPLMLKELSLVWSFCYHHPRGPEPGVPDFAEAVSVLARVRDDARLLLTHAVPLSRVQEGFDRAFQKRDGVLKVTIRPETDETQGESLMFFEMSDRAKLIEEQVLRFMDEYVYPNETTVAQQMRDGGDPHAEAPILKELRAKAKGLGLWNLFLPDEAFGAGLTNLEYTPLCEIMGRSPIAPRVFNCQAPDTGNAEILAEFGSEEQKKRWLTPLLEGEIRSCFSMTEPEVSGADPTGLRSRAVRDGDDWVINGHKWYTSGAIGAAFAIVMVVTDPDAAPHARASQIIVPTDAPGFDLIRAVSVMGHAGGGGHCEIRYEDCRVPAKNLLGPEHGGFMIAQARLGPGRIHHCMRAIGMAERAFEIMCRHANSRVAFGGPLGEKQFVQEWISTSRMEIDQARLLTLYAAHKMDKYSKREARQEISMIKVVVPNMLMQVLDRAIQCLGSLGMSDDTPIAAMWRNGRSLRIADGPDEVHKMVIARRELKRFA